MAEKLVDLMVNEDPEKAGRFIDYCNSLAMAKKKNGDLINPWMRQRTPEQLYKYYKLVLNDGFEFDGQHITLQSTGVSYDYIAYKNKMYNVYPESIIDVQLVYKDDAFSFQKQSGKVAYTHEINNPFDQSDKDIKGAYCVVKNKRGEFLTLLSTADIEKHRKVAKQDYIWKNWFKEMALKTVIKKACKTHFADMYQNIETLDNENYDLENPLDISIETKEALEKLETVEAVQEYYNENKGKNKGIEQAFLAACSKRKEAIVG